MAAIFAPLCDRSWVSLRQTAITFDLASVGYPRIISALERLNAPAPKPKPRGKSPGWSPGQPRSRRIR